LTLTILFCEVELLLLLIIKHKGSFHNNTKYISLFSQWEYQIGPLGGVEFGDQVWISRFLLHRIAEEYGVEASFDPKPLPGDWNGAGAHINFCYKDFRVAPQGFE
jgi:glutamine synthetase